MDRRCRPTKSPIALAGARRIDELFEIERAINGKPPNERLAMLRERSKPHVAGFETRLREQRALVSGKSEIGKAISCCLNRLGRVHAFLDDGCVLAIGELKI